MFQTFFKPMTSKLRRALTTRARQKRKAAETRHQKLAKALEMDALRRQAYTRDKGRSRVTGMPVLLHSSDPFKVAHLHHVKFLSAGGTDTLDNVCIVELVSHDAIHRHLIELTGNPNETLTITTRDPESGRIVARKESPCPS